MRWVVLTSLFPNSSLPSHGVFVRERVRATIRSSGGEAVVVAPVPWFPPLPGFGAWSRWARVPRKEQDGELEVLHPRYPLLPRVSTAVHPLLLAAGAARAVRRAEEGAALLDAHYLFPDGVAAVRIGSRLGLPVVLTARGSDVTVLARRRLPRAWIRSALRQAAAVVAVSKDLARRLSRLTGYPEERIEVIPNGVDGKRFWPGNRQSARAALGLPPTGRILLSAGRLVPEHRYDLLLGALGLLDPGLRPLLVCVGDGPDRTALEREARKWGIADRVRFVGEKTHEEMPAWYRAADAFVLASDREGCPNVVLEAIATGLPVLASRVGGIPEIVDAETGILVEENRRDAFAIGIKMLASRTFDPAAFERRTRERSWDAVGARLASLFQKVATAAL